MWDFEFHRLPLESRTSASTEKTHRPVEHVAPIAVRDRVGDATIVEREAVRLVRPKRVVQLPNWVGRIGELKCEVGECLHVRLVELTFVAPD